eukprot:TRINITY_DN13602_c0_g1_i2.p1 TRINITY_DN13602_c0_g1~~TRINITY_DN13602_c0_g1_i2.p1  ORF type:complete len:214 (+),score=55.30 TRINITY_DN13602_c0_g1_i2:314-955(+)
MLDFSTPNPVTEGKPFGAWWEHIHDQFVQTRVHREQMNSLVLHAASGMELRPGVKEAMLELQRLSIPVTVVSAGLTPVIEEVLEQAGLTADGVYVCANKPCFDEHNGRATHWEPSTPLHSRNKAGARLAYGDQFVSAADANRPHVLVLGDSLGDVHAAGGLCPESTTCLSVGFYDPGRVWGQSQEQFQEAYDVLLEGQEGDFNWLTQALMQHK